MTRDYLGSRLVLSLAVVLVDCTRGLCAADISMLKYLQQQHHHHHRSKSSSSTGVGTIDTTSPSGLPWLVVLTKCDLMSPTMVARSILATEQDLVANGLGLGSKVGPDCNVNDEDEDEDKDAKTHTTLNQSTSYQGMVVPVSAATGAGVQRLWLRLLHHARLSTIDHTDTDSPSQIYDTPSQIYDTPSQINPFAVREHRNAALLRKQDYLRQLSRFRKT